jgi:hypothetical protein
MWIFRRVSDPNPTGKNNGSSERKASVLGRCLSLTCYIFSYDKKSPALKTVAKRRIDSLLKPSRVLQMTSTSVGFVVVSETPSQRQAEALQNLAASLQKEGHSAQIVLGKF